jgi:ubiquinone biosynthesis protein
MSAGATRHRTPVPGRIVGGAAGFRQLLERLGPTYVKIGQFLALRPDLLSRDYSDELMRLLDHVEPYPWGDARATIEADLRCDLREFFAHVNPRPVAAGSLSQTHLARLHDGTEVAVKVQRPGVAERVERDLSRAKVIARVLQKSGIGLVISPTELLDELSHWMTQELDFQNELSNIVRLYDLAEGSPYERIPRPYAELSGTRVLTSEYLRGIPFSELLASLSSGSEAERERIERLGIDLDALARSLIACVLRQIFEYQFFHADVHPGNLLALPDGRIGFIDFGLCDQLDDRIRERQLRYLTAAHSQDVDLMFDAILDILVPGDDTDVAAFRRDFAAQTRRWMSRLQRDPEPPVNDDLVHVAPSRLVAPRNLGRRSRPGAGASDRGDHEEGVRSEDSRTTEWMQRTMRTVRAHGLQLPPRVMSMYRTMLTAETVAGWLSDDAHIPSVGGNFFARLRIQEQIRSFGPDQLAPTAGTLLELMRDGPRQVQRVLTDLSEGRLSMTVSVDEVPRTARAWRRRTRLMTTAILTTGLSTLLAAGTLPVIAGVPLSLPLAIALAGFYVSALVQWRAMR